MDLLLYWLYYNLRLYSDIKLKDQRAAFLGFVLLHALPSEYIQENSRIHIQIPGFRFKISELF